MRSTKKGGGHLALQCSTYVINDWDCGASGGSTGKRAFHAIESRSLFSGINVVACRNAAYFATSLFAYSQVLYPA